jgi:hypothetical protein
MKLIKNKRSWWTNHHWFSLGIHVDFDKKYIDIHFGKHVIVIGNNKIPNLPVDAKKELDTYWKEYCRKCNGVIKRCSMGHDHHEHNI